MSRFHLALLTMGALAIAGAAVVTWRIRQKDRSPVYSLEQLAAAARARDRVAIERYLDVARVAESVVDEAIAAASALGAPDPAMKPSLVSAMQQAIWSTLMDSLASLEGRYQGLADVQQRGGVARVGVRLRLGGGDSTVLVYLRMERDPGDWRVVGVEDLGPYMRASLERRRERAYESAMRSALRNLVTAQAAYYVDHASYTRSLGALTYETPPGVSVDIIEGGRDGCRAVARHAGASSECRIAVGSALPRGDTEREVKCSRPGVR